MSLVYLTCVADEQKLRFSRRDFQRIQKFAEKDVIKRHQIAGTPDAADIILFVGSSSPAYRDVTSSPLFCCFREKSVLMESGDKCIPIIPGIYAGLEKRWYPFSCSAATPGFYLRVAENDSLDMPASSESARYLFSFIGNADNHPVRRRILGLPGKRAYLRDSSTDSVRQSDGINGPNRDRGLNYREVIYQSKFVLCPRGIGVSSWRLFETIRAGRVPVIVSDGWIPSMGPAWDEFAVRVNEKDVAKIPEMLTRLEPVASNLGTLARQAWLEFYDEKVIFNTVVDAALHVLNQYRSRNKVLYQARLLRLLTPFFFRHWIASPLFRSVFQRSR